MPDPDLDDPLALIQGLMAGESRVVAVFLAPLTPTLESGIERFLADGSGPLAGIPAALKAQGAPEPERQARDLVASARGLLVTVLGHDHGVTAVPQFFHGSLPPAAIAHACAAVGRAEDAALRIALEQVAGMLGQRQFPQLIAGPGIDDVRAAWWDLAAGCIAASEAMALGTVRERQQDLAWCIGAALAALGGDVTLEDAESRDDLKALATKFGGLTLRACH